MNKKIDYNTPARKNASKKYDAKFSKITIRVPAEIKDAVYKHINDKGYKSMNSFILELFMNELEHK